MSTNSRIQKMKTAFLNADLDRPVHATGRLLAGAGAVMAALELGRTIQQMAGAEKADDDNPLTRVARVGAAVGTLATVANGLQNITRSIEDARRPYAAPVVGFQEATQAPD